MINIYELLKDTLNPLGFPVSVQGGYVVGTTLPPTFITYFVLNISNDDYANNKPIDQSWQVQLCFYSKSATVKQTADTLFQSVMLPANFMRQNGSSKDLPYDKDTKCFGYTSTYTYFELF